MAQRASLAFNIINPDSIDHYLRDFARHGSIYDEQLCRYLSTALGKALKKHQQNIRAVEKLPANAPEWLKRKWDNVTAFHEFVPDGALDEKISHIRDWIRGAVTRGEKWLRRTDAMGRPLKLLKIGSLDQALREAEKDMERQRAFLQKSVRRDLLAEEEILSGDIQAVLGCPDGFRFVQLMTSEAMDRETSLMGHCIGNGAYDSYLLLNNPESSYVYYSLRDADNQPHATLEVNFRERSVWQCKGKQNKSVHAKYHPYLKRFLHKTGLKIDKVAAYIGFFYHEGELYPLNRLPDKIVFNDTLDLRGIEDMKFPQHLKINGKLCIDAADRDKLPPGLTLNGPLEVHHYGSENFAEYVAEYYGLLDQKIDEKWYSREGLHREEGPAHVRYYRHTGVAIQEIWYRNGKLHREGAPAVTRRDPKTGEVLAQSRWIEGKPLDSPLIITAA